MEEGRAHVIFFAGAFFHGRVKARHTEFSKDEGLELARVYPQKPFALGKSCWSGLDQGGSMQLAKALPALRALLDATSS